MFLKKVSKNLNQTFTVGKNIVSGEYPSFVYRNILNENEIPVFCLHSATPGSFETMLRYLKENGYHTLSIDEFYQILINKKEKKTGRSILLTFDDGMGSVWSIAYPLLKKYGFKATVFLVPGRIKYRNKYYPNLEDVWVGTANMQEVLERDHSDQPFSTWEEVKTMHESGAFDFESHTFDHSLIFTSPEIVDFVNPAILSRYHLFEFPRIRCGEKEGQAQ
ncbi:MAG: polysaccharide deacetylase family protein, partial [Thermodesulfobacteriota bacterium]